MWKSLIPYMKKYRWGMVVGPALLIGEVVCEIFIPLMMGNIVDKGVYAGDVGYVVRMSLCMVLVAMVSLTCGILASRVSSLTGIGFGSELRRAMFEKLQHYSFKNIDNFSTASLVTRLTNDVTHIQNAFMMGIRLLPRAPVMLISAVVMALAINRSLSGVFFVALPILGVMLYTGGVFGFKRFRVLFKKMDHVNSVVQENLIAMRVVKAFVREEYETGKFNDANEALAAAMMKAEKLMILMMPVMQFTIYGCIIAVLWFGGKLVAVGSMRTGQLMSFVSYVGQIMGSMMMLSMIFIQLVTSRAALSRVHEVLSETPDIADPQTACGPVKDGSIRFENVSYAYTPGNTVLHDIDLSIASGETVGIIGSTGSGKGTLVQLIPRLYEATQGRVLVGGQDVRSYALNDLRNGVAMVLQNNVLFSGTIAQNLRWGKQDATTEEMEAACQAAGALDFVLNMPNGFDTELGQGGVNLSGGQKQRLCIARALIKHPSILILDDSTSAVDMATDAVIRAALRESYHDQTTLIIAQRIDSVRDADKIVVMERGRIEDIGTHEELLARCRVYKEVYNSQQKGV